MRIDQPDIKEAPEEASANRGFQAWVLVERGPPRRYRVTTSRPRYGDTGRTARILIGVILVPLCDEGTRYPIAGLDHLRQVHVGDSSQGSTTTAVTPVPAKPRQPGFYCELSRERHG